MGGKDTAPLLAVKVDRCCNTYWRLFLFLGILILTLIIVGMLMSSPSEADMQNIINNQWKDHWSESQSSDTAKKTIVEKQGKNVVESVETIDDYIKENNNPFGVDNEYYDEDRPDRMNAGRVGGDYMQQAQYDVIAAKNDKIKPAPLGVVPDIAQYSLQEPFKKMFRQQLQESIKFDTHYRNPCWAETIPDYPYQVNSYLAVSQQARVLEPQFQQMRKIFSTRKGPEDKWRLRCLPYYYVMETPPMGAPSLYTVLGYHPFIANPAMAEPEFWNLRGPDNIATLRDYLDLFDNAAETIRSNTTQVEKDGQMEQRHLKITGEGTSSYLWTIDSWKKLPGNEDLEEPKITTGDLIKSLNPDARIVIMLRNPTDRLFRGYLQRTEDASAADFHEKVGQAMESMSKCMEQRSLRSCLYDSQLNKRLKVRLRIGMYYPFVEDYIRVFGKDRVKVIRFEDYVKSTSETINKVCKFLEIPPYPTTDLEKIERQVGAMEQKKRENTKVKMLSATRAMLKEFHKGLNDKLADILGDDAFKWPEQSLDDATLLEADDDYKKEQEERAKLRERQQQQQQQSGQQSATGSTAGTGQADRPKTFKEMLEKIRARQKAALEQQQALRQQQMERIEQLRRQRQNNPNAPPQPSPSSPRFNPGQQQPPSQNQPQPPQQGQQQGAGQQQSAGQQQGAGQGQQQFRVQQGQQSAGQQQASGQQMNVAQQQAPRPVVRVK